MKRYFLFFILICNSYLIFAQFSDNYSDGDFLNNPSWIGDVTRFEVDSQGTLHSLIDTVNGESYLVTESKVTSDAVWEFDVFLDFNPSTSNYSKVYLMSDKEDLSSDLNGFFVKIGGQSGSLDEVSLYSQFSDVETEIIDGTDGLAASNPNLRIKVTRDMDGMWELFVGNSATSLVSQGSFLLVQSNEVLFEVLSDDGFINHYKKVFVLQN